MGCVSRRAVDRLWGSFHAEGEVIGEKKSLKLGATKAVNQRIQQTVQVGKDHEPVKHSSCFVQDIIRLISVPDNQQDHPGECAWQEAEGEHHHDGGYEKDRSLQLGLIPDGFLPESVDDAHRAVDQDDEGDDDLGEENRLSEAIQRFLN